MKKELYRVYLRDGDGNAVTFERFSCKSVKTVIRNMHVLVRNDLYKASVGRIHSIEYYSVTDGKIDKLLNCESV